MDWLNDVWETIKNGAVKDEKVNWVGVGIAGTLVAGTLFFGKVLGPLGIILGSLALGGAGLAIGGMVSAEKGMDSKTYDTALKNSPRSIATNQTPGNDITMTQVAGQEVPNTSYLRRVSKDAHLSVQFTDKVKRGIPLSRSTADQASAVLNHYRIITSDEKDRAAYRKQSDQYAQRMANRTRALEQSEAFLKAKGLIADDGGTVDALKEKLLDIKTDDLSLAGLMADQARQEGKDFDKLQLDELHALADNVLINLSDHHYHKAKEGAIKDRRSGLWDPHDIDVQEALNDALKAFRGAKGQPNLEDFSLIIHSDGQTSRGSAQTKLTELAKDDRTSDPLKGRLTHAFELEKVAKLQQLYHKHRALILPEAGKALSQHIEQINSYRQHLKEQAKHQSQEKEQSKASTDDVGAHNPIDSQMLDENTRNQLKKSIVFNQTTTKPSNTSATGLPEILVNEDLMLPNSGSPLKA